MPNLTPSEVNEIIDGWINREIRGVSTMTRNTECYNHMTEAAQRLKGLLVPPADTDPVKEPEQPAGFHTT